jgi:hypothetical protein
VTTDAGVASHHDRDSVLQMALRPRIRELPRRGDGQAVTAAQVPLVPAF